MDTYERALEALGDRMRRVILERLLAGPSPVGRLAEGLPVSRPAVSQHLRVLKDAGLVTDRREGTRRVYAVNPDGIEAVREYWNGFWTQALASFREAAERQAAGSRQAGTTERTDARDS